ncbi:MAG TPA: hypothetical protein VFA18_03390 [Gemmataceae bacterium]|nr:hypothetical protein [Gemmataceae bacterium]
MSSPDAPAYDAGPEDGPADGITALKQRIHRLEDAVAALQDTRALEDRVVERVAERVRQPEAPAADATPGLLSTASRRILPVLGLVRRDEESALPAAIPVTPPPPRSAWLVFDLVAELRTIVRMHFDRHYRMSWLARLLPISALVCVFLSWFFLDGHFWFIGAVLDKLIDLCLFVMAYKVLSREADRYRETISKPTHV